MVLANIAKAVGSKCALMARRCLTSGHGAHAKYMRVPVSTLVPLPDNLSFTTGAAISCGTEQPTAP